MFNLRLGSRCDGVHVQAISSVIELDSITSNSAMEKALHPDRDFPITPQEFWNDCGYKSAKRARCPACKQPMQIRGGDRESHAGGVFAHMPTTQGNLPVPCPLRNAADHRYTFLQEPQAHPEHAKRIRHSFFQNWEKHYSVIRKKLKFLDVGDFIDAINEADKTRLWHRSQLAEWEVAYIMLVTRDWPPVTTKDGKTLRSEWVRFWFDARVRTLDDLWIRRDGPVEIIKATYKKPSRGVPRATHLISADPFTVDTEFLSRPHRALHDFVSLKMRQVFVSELTQIAP